EPELPLLNLKDAPPLEKPVTEERILPEAEAEVAEKPIPVVGPVAASQNDDVPPILPAATTTPLVEVAPVIEPVSTKTGPELATEATVESSAELKTDPISEPTPDLKAEAKVEPITEPAMQSSVPQAEDKAETDPILETKEIQNEPLVILESNHRAWHEDLLDLDEAPATGRKSEAEKPAPWNLDEATKEPKIHEKSAILPEEFEEVSAAQNEPPMVAAVRPIALEQRLPQEAKRPVRVEPPAPEEERRGFFSRMFGKTTPEKNSDY
ncbi:MAG: hypothetical protein ABI992_07950, partial [Chthoniobacterales bacterium]